MGFNTTVFILNDGLRDIERHPEEFVKGIRHKMDGGGTLGVGNHANCVEVMPTAHADTPRLYYTHANSMLELSTLNKETMRLYRSIHAFQKEFVTASADSAEEMLKRFKRDIVKFNRDA